MFFECCGSFWCAVHYLGVSFRCTNTFVLCIPCNVVILIKLIIQAIKFKFYFIAMVDKGAQVLGQSGDPTDG